VPAHVAAHAVRAARLPVSLGRTPPPDVALATSVYLPIRCSPFYLRDAFLFVHE